MNEIIINIISVVVTSIVLPLIALCGRKLIQFFNAKIKNEDAKRFLTAIANSTENAVRYVTQTYVDSLKESNSFDKEAQQKALELAKAEALKSLTQDAQDYIKETYGDVGEFMILQIEAMINSLKAK